jgi:hypothetical protein
MPRIACETADCVMPSAPAAAEKPPSAATATRVRNSCGERSPPGAEAPVVMRAPPRPAGAWAWAWACGYEDASWKALFHERRALPGRPVPAYGHLP